MKRCLAIVLAMVGCAASEPKAPAPQPPQAHATPLAALLASNVCAEIERRTFSLASARDDIVDTYVRVTDCRARAEGDEIAFHAAAVAWVALDRGFGAVALTSFVHATVRIEARGRVEARDAGGRLEITWTPRGAPSVEVEPMGLIEPLPENWAAFVGLELAPSAGVVPETLAKQRLKTDSEAALRDELARPRKVTYDARSGSVVAGAAPRTGRTRVRVVPHGTAEVGPFPRTVAATTVRAHSPFPVAARGVCLSHAEHVLEADRRGEEVTMDEWPVVDGETPIEVPPMPCAWTLALRTLDERSAILDVDEPTLRDVPRDEVDPPDRWVALDGALDAPDDEVLRVELATDAWHVTRDAHDLWHPAIAVLAPDERVRVRLLRRDGTRLVTVSDQPLDLGSATDARLSLTLPRLDGAPPATLRLHARTRIPALNR
jgi:hypothetical protein